MALSKWQGHFYLWNKKNKMKLRAPDNFTGWHGAVEFKDGVSVRIVSPREANRLRVCVNGIEVMEDDGETVDAVLNAMSHITALDHYLDIGALPPSPYLTKWDGTYPKTVEEVKAEEDAKAALPVKTEPKELAWTREKLEKLADEHGIAGLRTIGDEYGVKAASISKLITMILEAVASKAG